MSQAIKQNIPRGHTLHTLWQLTWRNCLLFLKNKTTIVFSLMAPVLILVFYVLFLSDLQVGLVMSEIEKLGVFVTQKQVQSVVNAWLISGVVSIACLTVSLNSMFVMIADKEKRTIHDFMASPLKTEILSLSYFLACFILTFTLCLIVLAIGIVFLIVTGGVSFAFSEVMWLVLTLFLSCLSADFMMLCIMSLFKTNAASAAFTGVFSALIGFLIGAYLPVSILPEGVQNFANLIPGSHATALFRSIFIEKSLTALPIEAYEGIAATVNETYAVNLMLFGAEFTRKYMYLYLTGSIFIFAVIYLIINRLQARAKKYQ